MWGHAASSESQAHVDELIYATSVQHCTQVPSSSTQTHLLLNAKTEIDGP